MNETTMKQTAVTMVRVYCSEKDHQHQRIIDMLHGRHRVAGVTAFRGITGFGRSGAVHEAGLIDLALDLPVVIEFFDRPDTVANVLPLVHDIVGPGHIVSWPAQANLD
jgi:PII-like signaling protein